MGSAAGFHKPGKARWRSYDRLMRYRLTDIPAMLGTPAGRRQIADGIA
jgi:hypothetical protein